MKNILPLISSLFLSTLCFGQKSYTFLPKWSAGETKTITNKLVTLKYEQDVLKGETKDESKFKISVLNENDTHIFIALQYDNILFDSWLLSDINFDNEFKSKNDIRIEYKIDKKSAEPSVVNQKQTYERMQKSIAAIHEKQNSQSTEEDQMSTEDFSNYNSMFSSAESIELFVGDDLVDLLYPLGEELILDKAIQLTDSCANPFNKNQKLKASAEITLKSFEEQNGICNINMTVLPDMSGFKEMMFEMIKRFGKNSPDSVNQKKLKEVEKFDINVLQNYYYVLNYKTGWNNSLKKVFTTYGTDPKKGKYKTITTVDISIE